MSLGVDGKYLNGTDEIFVLGDVKSREFFGVTTDNSQKKLIQILQNRFIDKGIEIEVANMDMDRRFKVSIGVGLIPPASSWRLQVINDKRCVWKNIRNHPIQYME